MHEEADAAAFRLRAGAGGDARIAGAPSGRGGTFEGLNDLADGDVMAGEGKPGSAVFAAQLFDESGLLQLVKIVFEKLEWELFFFGEHGGGVGLVAGGVLVCVFCSHKS